MQCTKMDIFGCDVTLSNDAALEAFNAAMMGFLAHSAATPDHLVETLEKAPDFALGHVCKGFFCLLLGQSEMCATAREAAAAAHRAAESRSVTPREARYIDALDGWLAGKPSLAISAMEKVLESWPHDALAMKLSQAIRFTLGDARGMRDSIERIMPHYANDHVASGYAFGCHAFALEETGEYAAAKWAGNHAMDRAADDAWGLHAVTHVYDMTGDATGGIEWLSGRENSWAHCNNFRYHVWWHKALLHLDTDDITEVMRLYDEQIRADKTDDYRDISNAASLLSRLELDGHNVGSRWEELAAISEGRADDGSLVFADLHYLLALIGGDRCDARDRLIARMKKDAAVEQTEMDAIKRDPGLSAAQGLEAFGEGDYANAFRNLASARSSMQSIGGSHAQRDVFERLTIEAAIRGGYFDAARTFLSQRTALRNGKMDSFAASRMELIDSRMGESANIELIPAE